MSSSRRPSSALPIPFVKVEFQDHSDDQVVVFTPRPIIIPSTNSLPRMMRMGPDSQGVAEDYMEL